MESIVRFIKDLDWANNIFSLLLGALLTKLCSWIFAQVNYIKRKQKMKKTTNCFLTEGINSLDHAEKRCSLLNLRKTSFIVIYSSTSN